MKVIERNVIRLAAVQHLRATHGIKTKHWNKNKAAGCKLTPRAGHSVKVFGVPLENLPQSSVEYGSVPSFLVDACTSLKEHVDTEGLFRKSGSIVRLKALRAKLDTGEKCLSTALPCDVAGLVKLFFRELPEPVVPAELHEAFLKAQQLPSAEERTSATLLLSCVLPDRNLSVLRYFFVFLHDVSQRSAANKMDSSNLSVILAPNLLHSGDGTEKMNAGTEKRLKLQAAVVHCLIENAQSFGVVPDFLMERVPAMLGCEAGVPSPSRSQDGLEELDANSGTKKRRRRSMGDMVNGALNKLKTNRTPTNTPQSDRFVFSSATPVIMTPNIKRKLPSETGQSYGFSNKRQRSIKKNLGIELLPNALFGGSSTPGPEYVDPSGSGLDSSQNALPSAGKSSRHAVSSSRRKSRRLSNRHAVSRVESGKAGCFSPKAAKKETGRKSLRLRFSLGKSSRDAGSETIGLRLATQESSGTLRFAKDTGFSPAGLRNKRASKGSKLFSKSEDNLLTPQCDISAHRTSWSGETPDGRGPAFAGGGGSFTDTPMSMCLRSSYYSSEPAIIVTAAAKPPTGAAATGAPRGKLCCASSAESLEGEDSFGGGEAPRARAGPTLLKIKRAAAEPRPPASARSPGSMPPPAQPRTPKATLPNKENSGFPTPQTFLADDQNVTFDQIEIVPLSPLHIDSTLFEEAGLSASPEKVGERSSCAARASLGTSVAEETEAGATEEKNANCSRLIDALDIQSPAHFQLGVSSSGVQSTPYRASGLGVSDDNLCTPLPSSGPVTVRDDGDPASPEVAAPRHAQEEEQEEEPPSPGTLESRRLRVAEHIRRFNKLTLYSPKAQQARAAIRSPMKFQRTPVRQSVRRINSLLGDRRRAPAGVSSASPVVKAVSLESGLSAAGARLRPYQGEPGVTVTTTTQDKARPAKTAPPVPPKKPSTLARRAKMGALGDVTNKAKANAKGDAKADSTPVSKTATGAAQKTAAQHVAERDVCRYRGSPRNPLNVVTLLSATKPIDL